MRTGTATLITAYAIPLSPVSSFKYREVVLSVSDDDWLEVVRNLSRAQQKWAQLTRVLGRVGVDAWTLGMLYAAVVQAVFLDGSETWVMTPRIGRDLGGFHHRVARRLTGRKPQRGVDWRWRYTPLVEAMEEAGLQEVDTYLSRHQNKFSQLIAARPIMDLRLVA